MRELCLGLEVVTAQGEVWSSLRGLRKDNTSYDLRDLLIGSKGTLGIITAAVIKLFPQPKARVTALAAMDSPQAPPQLLMLAQTACGSALTGFELMSDVCLQLVAKHFPHMMPKVPQGHRQYVLVELSDDKSEQHANDLMGKLFQQALEQSVVDDAVLATSIAQSEQLWNLREHIPLAQTKEGRNLKHDISLPVSQISHSSRRPMRCWSRNILARPSSISGISATATCITTWRPPSISAILNSATGNCRLTA